MNLLPAAPDNPLDSLLVHCEVKTVKDFADLVWSFPASDAWVFRGQRRSNWNLTTSLERLMKSVLVDRSGASWRSTQTEVEVRLRSAEAYLLDEFRRRSQVYLPTERLKTDFDWFAFMQHHGVPTRLLDWTESPYIALYFAVSEMSPDDTPAVWALRTDLLFRSPNDQVSLAQQPVAPTSTQDRHAIFLDEIDVTSRQIAPLADFHESSHVSVYLKLFEPLLEALAPHPGVTAVRPAHMSARLMAQQGLFLAGTDIKKTFEKNLLSVANDNLPTKIIYKITIRDTSRLVVLGELARMGISCGSLFPDINGLGTYVRERFELDSFRGTLRRAQK